MTSRALPLSNRTLAFAVLATLVGVAGVAFGCSKEQTPTAEQPKSASKTEVSPAAVPPGGGDKSGAAVPASDTETSGAESAEELEHAKSAYTESNFDLAFRAKGDGYHAGKDAEAEIFLQVKSPFHANDKYPYKFKLADTDGVSFPDKIVKKDKAKVEGMKVTMSVPFSAAKSGKKQIRGVFHFSVCSEDKCLIEKRALSLDVDVK
jgi:hypothetical protein